MNREKEVQTSETPLPSTLDSKVFSYARNLKEKFQSGLNWVNKNRLNTLSGIYTVGGLANIGYLLTVTKFDLLMFSTGGAMTAAGLLSSANNLYEQSHQKDSSPYLKGIAVLEGLGCATGAALIESGNPNLYLSGLAITGTSTILAMIDYASRSNQTVQI